MTMRLIDILPDSFLVAPYLMERAIVNIKEIQRYVNVKARALERYPAAQQWYKSQFFKFLANRETNPNIIVPVKGIDSGMLKAMPSWMRQDAAKGELYDFVNHTDLQWQAIVVLEWLLYEYDGGKNPLRRGMTWEQALAAAEEDRRNARREEEREWNEQEIRKGIKIIKEYSNGYYWVFLGNDACIADEGERQQNCLRDFEGGGASKQYYSLRNETGKSLVTIAIFGERLHVGNIKGKQNKEIPWEHWKYVIDFVHNRNIGIISQHNNGLSVWQFSEIAQSFGYELDRKAFNKTGLIYFLRRKEK